MEENELVAAELHQAKMLESAINLSSRNAITSTLLEPHQYLTLLCDECGEPLVVFRMERGLRTCVHCQSNIEKGRKPSSRAV